MEKNFLSLLNHYGALTTCQILEKLMRSLRYSKTDQLTDQLKDRWTTDKGIY